MSDQTEILDRFHRTLIAEIAQRRPEYLGSPFTVAEIYQNLIPYGTHRDRLGVDMNGDYEHALVRLLAGEGGFLLLESEAALRALREELRSSNPNTGVYREYAAVDVRLNPVMSPSPAEFDPAPPEDVDVVPMEDLVPVGDLAPGGPEPRRPEPDSELAAAAVPGRVRGDTCRWCRADLPRRDGLRFCPFCGTDVNVVPCPSCGEELEPEWRFCVACGSEVGG